MSTSTLQFRLPARALCSQGLHGGRQALKHCVRTGRLAQQLQQQIDSISADCGAPVFEPHVTLIGGVHRPEAEVLSVAADLAARLQVYVASQVLSPVCATYAISVCCTKCCSASCSRAPPCARCAQPYQLQFQDVHFGAIFHQCVYIRIQPQPHVMHAGAETRAAYGGDRDATYMPHLSLLYSDIDEDAR